MANEDSTRGLMYPALQRFNNALENLDSFRKEKCLLDNIGLLDNFFTGFRSTTFVLQKSLAHTDYLETYSELCDKYFNTENSKWFVRTRNEIEKEQPFDLTKSLIITVFQPQSALVLTSKVISVENDVPYDKLIEGIKRLLIPLNLVEVHFSIEFCFSKAGDDHDLYDALMEGISSMIGFLTELYGYIGDSTPLCDELISRINASTFNKMPKDALFIDDCVFYPETNQFEFGDRLSVKLPTKEPVPISNIYKAIHYPGRLSDSKDFLKAIVKMHCPLYVMQKTIMPTFFIVDNKDNCIIDSYQASIRTTTYRKINDLAIHIMKGEIKHITLVYEAYSYEAISFDAINQLNVPYPERVKSSTGELLVFDQIGRFFKYRSYKVDVKKISDPKYVKAVLKQRPEENGDIEHSLFLPLYNAFKELGETKTS